ncbi:MAG: DegV family protein [Clostridiales bacterium]|nr:DegV family protein [Bacillota bacterium]NLK04279.1 DegV family protein [Clostridiales bacterium]
MRDYVIVSDATLDLPYSIIKEYDIRVIPMGVDINDHPYSFHPDERDLKIDDFYSQLRAGASTHTTQITPIVFMDYFEELIKSNLDILYISFSSGLSGTYNTSQLVVEDLRHKYPDRKIYSVDSKCASIGEGLLVLNSAMQKKKGLTIEELRDWVEDHKYDSRHWFTVRDLFHLKRGGRVSSIEAVVGTALRIRPILSTNEEGRLVVVSKIRGAKAEMDFLINKMTEEGEDLSSQIVIVGHGDNLEQAKQLEKQIRSMNIIKDVVIAQIGPIIGSHTGPDMLALVYMGKK